MAKIDDVCLLINIAYIQFICNLKVHTERIYDNGGRRERDSRTHLFGRKTKYQGEVRRFVRRNSITLQYPTIPSEDRVRKEQVTREVNRRSKR